MNAAETEALRSLHTAGTDFDVGLPNLRYCSAYEAAMFYDGRQEEASIFHFPGAQEQSAWQKPRPKTAPLDNKEQVRLGRV